LPLFCTGQGLYVKNSWSVKLALVSTPNPDSFKNPASSGWKRSTQLGGLVKIYCPFHPYRWKQSLNCQLIFVLKYRKVMLVGWVKEANHTVCFHPLKMQILTLRWWRLTADQVPFLICYMPRFHPFAGDCSQR
jgi:hypothetical protein